MTVLLHTPGKAIEALNLHLTRDREPEGWQWYDDQDYRLLRAVVAEFPQIAGAECGMWWSDKGGKYQWFVAVEGLQPFKVEASIDPGGADSVKAEDWRRGMVLVLRTSIGKRVAERFGVKVRRYKERSRK